MLLWLQKKVSTNVESNDASSVTNNDYDYFYDEDIGEYKEEDEGEKDNPKDPDWQQTPLRKRRLVSYS